MPDETTSGLHLNRLNKSFGSVEALKEVELRVKTGEFFTLLGPSGCGKTTLMRIIAGLELPDSGRVILDGQDLTSLPAAKRQVNTVFQSYALFPHLDVYENVAFGLRARRFDSQEVKRRVELRLDMLDLSEMAQRYPHQISGGQKQRVALARALVNEPQILLLDEPMSALDAKLRLRVQEDLRRLQRQLGTTFIMVTHDQAEALVCSDRLAVMHQGRIIQTDQPEKVYDYPRNKFVADFLGAANTIEATRVNGGVETEYGFLRLDEEPQWEQGLVAIRPEWISIHKERPAENGVRARVTEVIYRGASFDLHLSPGRLRVRTSSYKHFKPGDQVWLKLAASELSVLEDSHDE